MSHPAPDPQKVGDRIEARLRQLQARLDDATMADVEEVLSLLTTLYGAGLANVVDVLRATPDGEALVARLADDKLVATLLILHDLHPDLRASDFDSPAPTPPVDVWTPVNIQPVRPTADAAGSFS
ncbi:MAG: hypothetical protein JO054_04075 [Actinobacteria bacterium]|nr:hypothetical protein [Actinomycetota bacterium]